MTDEPRSLESRAWATTALLQHFAWARRNEVPGLYEVWASHDVPDEEILLPLDPSRGDYRHLLLRALRTIEHRYGSEVKEVEDLLLMRAAAHLDSTQWRRASNVDAGLIDWMRGIDLYAAATDSLTAAAKSTREPRLHHGRASAYLAQHFLASTLMGQTDNGSFIVTAHTPATASFHVSAHAETEAEKDYRKSDRVTGRQILNTLQRAVEAVRSGLDEYKSAPNIEAFIPLVDDGVSAELVRSIAAMTTGSDAAIFIERLPDPGERPTPRVEVEFDSVEAEVLLKVADRFVEAAPPQPVRVTGEVTRLDNSTTSQVRLIRLEVVDGAAVRQARVRLDAEQYEQAVEAHRLGRYVQLSGSLEKDGKSFWIYGAKDLSVLPAPEGPESRSETLFEEGDSTAQDTDSA